MVAKLKTVQSTRQNLERLIEQHKKDAQEYRLEHPNFEAEFDEFNIRTFDPAVVLAYLDDIDSVVERNDDELNDW